MKVILLRDVAKLGKRFSVVETPDGYALNKLIPQGLAEPATPENLKRVEARTKEVALHKAADEASLREALNLLKDKRPQIIVGTNAQGHLFQAVKVADVVDALKQLGIHIAETALSMDAHVKTVGEHTIMAKQGGVTGSFIIEVVGK